MAGLHLTHAIVVRSHLQEIDAVILTPETVGTVGTWAVALSVGFSIQNEATDVARSAPQGTHYHADVIFLFPYLGIKKGRRGHMVLPVRPTPTRFPTNILNTPLDSRPLNVLPSVKRSWWADQNMHLPTPSWCKQAGGQLTTRAAAIEEDLALRCELRIHYFVRSLQVKRSLSKIPASSHRRVVSELLLSNTYSIPRILIEETVTIKKESNF